MRRFTPSKRARARPISPAERPRPRTSAIAPRALRTLWRPASGEESCAAGQARLEQRELRALRGKHDVARREIRARVSERNAHDRCARVRRERGDARVVDVQDDDAVLGHEAHDLAKRLDHGREVRVEVRVVVLDVADEEMPRLVVQELRTAVEERRVVLVALEDEGRAASAPVAVAEVAHLAADEKARIAPRVEQQPRRQRRGRRLAVRPRDDDGGPARQQVLPHGLWQGEDGQTAPRGLGRLDVVAQRRVADDDGVAIRRHVLGRKALRDRDAQLREQGGHGRVEGAVASGHDVALFPQEGGQGHHGRPAHRHEVKVTDFAHLSVRSLV